MRWTLRLIAAWQTITAVVAGLTVADLASTILRRTGLGPALLFGMVGALVFSAFATVQLWRLRQSGRHATLALSALWAFLWVWSSGPRLSIRDVVWVGILTLAAAVVAQGSARRACR